MNKIIIQETKEKRPNYILEWLIRMIGYTIILIFVSMIFKETVYIDSQYFWLWGLIAAIIIDILNMFIKPVLIILMLPVTILTLGILYPLVNVIILYLTDFILGSHFELGNLFMTFMVAVFISIMNNIMDKVIFNYQKR